MVKFCGEHKQLWRMSRLSSALFEREVELRVPPEDRLQAPASSVVSQTIVHGIVSFDFRVVAGEALLAVQVEVRRQAASSVSGAEIAATSLGPVRETAKGRRRLRQPFPHPVREFGAACHFCDHRRDEAACFGGFGVHLLHHLRPRVPLLDEEAGELCDCMW